MQPLVYGFLPLRGKLQFSRKKEETGNPALVFPALGDQKRARSLVTFQPYPTTDSIGLPRPRYPRGIWKRRFDAENPSNVFRPRYAGGIEKRNNHRSFWICVWGKLGQGNHMILVTLSFSKTGSVFKMVFVHDKCWRFQIPPVWRAFSKSSVFVTD